MFLQYINYQNLSIRSIPLMNCYLICYYKNHKKSGQYFGLNFPSNSDQVLAQTCFWPQLEQNNSMPCYCLYCSGWKVEKNENVWEKTSLEDDAWDAHGAENVMQYQDTVLPHTDQMRTYWPTRLSSQVLWSLDTQSSLYVRKIKRNQIGVTLPSNHIMHNTH